MEKNIYIYGAGLYARILCSYFQLVKSEQQIRGFIVSDANGNLSSLFGLRVYGFESIRPELDDNSVIYIAVSDNLLGEISSLLDDNGIKNYVAVDLDMQKEIIRSIKDYFDDNPVQSNKIIIECYDGADYCCNPKYIVEGLHKTGADIDVVWSVQNGPREGFPEYVRQVEKFSKEYFYEFYTSRLLISNSGMEFNARRKEQYHIETWHGTGPLKKSGYDASYDASLYMETMEKSPDVCLAASEFNVGFYRTAYHYKGEVMRSGFPRNDIFFKENEETALKIYRTYNIDPNKKIVLYAPTFRGWKSVKSFDQYDMDIDKVMGALKERFGDEYVLLGRYHHFLRNYTESKRWQGEVINVSDYPDTQELLVSADVLITDYSSIMWDFSLQRKPVFLYHNDEKEYLDERGFYCPPRELPYPTGHDNEELCNKILNFDEQEYVERLNAFFDKYGAFDKGDATDQVVSRIMKVLNGMTFEDRENESGLKRF